MYSLNPELELVAQGDARMATWEWIPATDELRWTSGQTDIYARPAHEIDSLSAWEALVHPQDRPRLHAALDTALREESGYRERFRVVGKDGNTIWIFGYGKVVRGEDGSTRIVGLNIDLTDWIEVLQASLARFTATFEQAAVGIAHVAPSGKWLHVNRRCLEILGYSREELLGRTFSDITHPDDLEVDLSLVNELLQGTRSTYSMEKRYYTKERRIVWVNLTVSLVRKPDGSPNYFIAVIEDITRRKKIEAERDDLIAQLEDRVKERTAKLEQLTQTDPLTGIANRRRFDQFIEAEWNRGIRSGQPLSVLLIDIDSLKELNDSIGHVAADAAIQAVAKCLNEVVLRVTDLAARIGGDEFVLVLPDTNERGVLRVAERIHAKVRELEVAHPKSRNLVLTVSQGSATTVPDPGRSWKALMREADRALYRAKEAGRNRFEAAQSVREETS